MGYAKEHGGDRPPWTDRTAAQIAALVFSLFRVGEERLSTAELAKRLDDNAPPDLNPISPDKLGRCLTLAGWQRAHWRPPGQAPVRGFLKPAAAPTAPPYQDQEPEQWQRQGFASAGQKRAYDRGAAELTAMAETAIKAASNLREQKRIARISEWALTRASRLLSRDIPKPDDAIAAINQGRAAILTAKDPSGAPGPSAPKLRFLLIGPGARTQRQGSPLTTAPSCGTFSLATAARTITPMSPNC